MKSYYASIGHVLLMERLDPKVDKFGGDIHDHIEEKVAAAFDDFEQALELQDTGFPKVRSELVQTMRAVLRAFSQQRGASRLLLTSRWDFTLRVGVGLDAYITENWLINVELAPSIRFADYRDIPRETTDNVTLTVSGGIPYRF